MQDWGFWQNFSIFGIPGLIKLMNLPFFAQKLWQLLHLCHAKGSIEVGQPQIVTNGIMLKSPRMWLLSGGAEMFGLLCQFMIMGNQNPTSTCGEDFIAIKTKNPHITKGACMLLTHHRAQTFCGILYHRNLILPTDPYNLLNLTRHTQGMHGHTGGNSLSCGFVVALPLLYDCLRLKVGLQRLSTQSQSLSTHIQK